MTPKLCSVVHILIKKFNAVKGRGGAISTHRNEISNSCLSCYVVLNRVLKFPVKNWWTSRTLFLASSQQKP